MAPLSQMIPSILYSSSSSLSSWGLAGAVAREEPVAASPSPTSTAATSLASRLSRAPFTAFAPAETKIEMYSPKYYGVCAIGGILSCGITHTAVTPLDVVKCNMQIDPTKYKSIASGFGLTAKEQGMAGLVRGWVPTAIGYSIQGACKFGLYEVFKKYYADLAGEENAKKYKTFIFLAGSASAEFFADIGLCPFEAVKVKVQTVPGYAKGFSDGFPKFVAENGYSGLFKGLGPLWGRQIPYTMMKFACFENTVAALYQYVVPKPKAECTKSEQLGVSFAAGYIAGVFCAVVSHPADNLVSKLNSVKGATVGSIVNEMGWVALFTRGLPLRIIMIGTLTGLQWGIYDAFKVYVGLPTTGSEPAKK